MAKTQSLYYEHYQWPNHFLLSLTTQSSGYDYCYFHLIDETEAGSD